MQLFTKEFIALHKKYNENRKNVHDLTSKYVNEIVKLSEHLKTKDILDYGCGNGCVRNNLEFDIKNYDPSRVEFDNLPEPADIVTCINVLEYVEPSYLLNVINHIHSLTKKAVMFVINLKGDDKKLSPDIPYMITVREAKWWVLRLLLNFELDTLINHGDSVFILARPREPFPNYREFMADV